MKTFQMTVTSKYSPSASVIATAARLAEERQQERLWSRIKSKITSKFTRTRVAVAAAVVTSISAVVYMIAGIVALVAGENAINALATAASAEQVASIISSATATYDMMTLIAGSAIVTGAVTLSILVTLAVIWNRREIAAFIKRIGKRVIPKAAQSGWMNYQDRRLSKKSNDLWAKWEAEAI